MKITVYLKGGAFVHNEVDLEAWESVLENIHTFQTIQLFYPRCLIRCQEITHIIEQPNQTENT